MDSSNLAVWTLLSGAIGGGISSIINGIITYRKTRDAGQLEIIKAEQASQSGKIEMLEKQHHECEERHAKALVKLTEAVEKQAELKGELTALKHLVVKDVQATNDLRTEVAALRDKP